HDRRVVAVEVDEDGLLVLRICVADLAGDRDDVALAKGRAHGCTLPRTSLITSPTVRVFSDSSSEISIENSSSIAMTTQTRSRLSAPRSSTVEAVSTTLSGSTLSVSAMRDRTRVAMSSGLLISGLHG